jgi:hypothetical protein
MLSPARHAFGLEVDSVGPTWRCQKESPHVGVLPRRRLEIARLGNKLLLCSALLRFSPFLTPPPAQSAGGETNPPAAADQRAPAMEFFPDGAFVRLQSRVHRTYLRADEDGVSLIMSPERASLHAAWRVHQIVRNDTPYVLLYNAAYGRYLAATNQRAPFGLSGQRAVQGFYDEQDSPVVWVPDRVVHHTAGEDRDRMVLMQLVPDNRLLRCNGKYFRRARYGVSVDSFFSRSKMMHWVVEIIPPLPAVPIFPPPKKTPASPPPVSSLSTLYDSAISGDLA